MKKEPAKTAKRRIVKKTVPAQKNGKDVPAEHDKNRLKPFPIVGIGASAGGLEASCKLLKHLKTDLGMAYVFVHHLAPDYDSHLPEILQRETVMPVVKVTNGIPVLPDNVYVIPPNMTMTLMDGHLILRPRESQSPYNSIDYFLLTLASACQHNAIAILLSGTASDGTLGLKAIKEQGGITMVQDETASHPEMPSHAQEAGYADYVLPPNRLAEELAALIKHRNSVALPSDELPKNEKAIKKILSVVLRKYEVDFFSHYKRSTVYRRIMRRMALNRIENFEDYFEKIQQEPNELRALFEDFLINVTSFFREPAFYEALKKIVFPKFMKDRKTEDPIRVWIPGCATGEEAYSTAICITEFLKEQKHFYPVQIFSTDLDEKAIQKARQGIYSKSAVQQISAQRLKNHFTKIDGHYQIEKSIRDMCIFSVHNLMKDPPFSRMDLISCQNVLIYIEAAPQRKILQTFHYGLKPTGFLVLGKSESIGNATELFQSVGTDPKLYIKKNQTLLPRLDFIVRAHPTVPASLSQEQPEARTETDVEKESDKVLLSRYVPASVLINKDLEIIRFRGATAPFFQPASGKASLNLLKMLREEFIFEIRSLLQKAKKSESPVSKGDIYVDSSGEKFSIEIIPIRSAKDLYFLIIFQSEWQGTGFVQTKPRGTKTDQRSRLSKLEYALKDAREQIRAITEDFDTSREELQSANEEILSSNEELQSINEELETSKEELQSANEELITINEELQTRLGELKEAHDYSAAIIGTMHGPLLVLNTEMRIRTANNAFYEFFKLDPDHTEGKLISDLQSGRWEIPALSDHLKKVFPRQVAFEHFEINHDFPQIGNRTMVVNAHKLVHGSDETKILLAFEDITMYRRTEQELRQTQEQLQLALTGGSVGTWYWNIKTGKVMGSKEQAALFGRSDGTFFSNFQEWTQALHPEDTSTVERELQESIKQRKPLDIEFRIVWPDGSVHWILSKAYPYYDWAGEAEKMVGVNINVTERRRAIEALAESEKRFHNMSDNAPVMIWMADESQHCTFLNKTWLSFTGKKLEEECGAGWYKGIHPEDLDRFLQVYDNAYANKEEFKIDYRIRRADGQYRWVMNYGVPRRTTEGTFIGYIGTCIDINDRIDLERQKDDFMGIASHELKTPVTSIKAYAQILQEKFRKANDTASASMLGRLDMQIDKLTNLINTLLDVARIQSGQMDYDQEFFDINTFIQEIKEDIQEAYPEHQIIITLNAKGEVFADRARIGQVLNNLISNAVKYSPDSNKIVIETELTKGEFIFSVRDYGLGVPIDQQDKIFQRFYRVSESSGNRVAGLGLGLFISSQIVKQQGGKIWLESQPGKGSQFSFSLPEKRIKS
jgi:two-component system CheB/CheR fusion protein